MSNAEVRAKPSRTVARYGPWAVVTGASDGIGRAFAVALAEAGVHVVLVARREQRLRDLAAELTRAHGVATRVIALDLALAGQAERIDRETADLDVGLLVAAAGFGVSGSFFETDPAAEMEMIDVNCRALAISAQAFARRFVARKRGGILLMSSLLAFQGVPRAANYAATKAYVQTLAEGLHRELAPLGVDVLASAPGPVKSGFGARAGMRIGAAGTPEQVARGSLNALGRRATVRPGLLAKALEWALTPLPRWGRVTMMGRIMSGMTARFDRP